MKYWIIQDPGDLAYHIINSKNQFSSSPWKLSVLDLFPFKWDLEDVWDSNFSGFITLKEALLPSASTDDPYILVLETDEPPTLDLIESQYPELLL